MDKTLRPHGTHSSATSPTSRMLILTIRPASWNARLITPYTFKGDELPRELYDNAMHVNVAIGEEKDFVFSRDREALVTLSFQAGDNRRIFWKRTPDEAQRFLTRWVQQGKAIVTSSNGYSFAEGDLEEHPVLRGLPHTVVAISDLRSVWTRIAFNGGQGLSGSKTVSVAVMSTPEGSTQYAFLVLSQKKITRSSSFRV